MANAQTVCVWVRLDSLNACNNNLTKGRSQRLKRFNLKTSHGKCIGKLLRAPIGIDILPEPLF
jgi:hypothetical protein